MQIDPKIYTNVGDLYKAIPKGKLEDFLSQLPEYALIAPNGIGELAVLDGELRVIGLIQVLSERLTLFSADE